MFFSYPDVFCDLLLNKSTAVWDLLFYVIKKQNVVNGDFIRASFSPIDHKNQSNYVRHSAYHINKTVVIVTVAVPFPNSSTMTNEFSVAAFTAVAT